MRLVIIESPWRGEIERNKRYALRCLEDSIARGEAPLASHLLYTQVLDDTDPLERHMGISLGHAWTRKADLVAVYQDYGSSLGMHEGVALAKELGIQVSYRMIGTNPK